MVCEQSMMTRPLGPVTGVVEAQHFGWVSDELLGPCRSRVFLLGSL